MQRKVILERIGSATCGSGAASDPLDLTQWLFITLAKNDREPTRVINYRNVGLRSVFHRIIVLHVHRMRLKVPVLMVIWLK